MLRKLFLIFSFLTVVLLATILLRGNSSNELNQEQLPNATQKTELDEAIMYYQVYKKPSVIFLRNAINAYLVDDSTEQNISVAAVQEDQKGGVTSGLEAFDPNYYKSKFVVFTIANNIAGGEDIEIIFQDKPDRLFYAWVYKLSDGNFELRSFSSKDVTDKKAFAEMIDQYKSLVFDKEHSI